MSDGRRRDPGLFPESPSAETAVALCTVQQAVYAGEREEGSGMQVHTALPRLQNQEEDDN